MAVVEIVCSEPLEQSSSTNVFVKGEKRYPGVTVRQAQGKEG